MSGQPVRDYYRRLLPTAIRGPAWAMRRYLWNRLSGASQESIRDSRAQLLLSLGRTVGLARLADGRKLYVDLRDEGVGRPVYRDGNYEPAEAAFIAGFLGPGMTVVDVGANLGYHTMLAANSVGLAGRVIAYEPDPWNYELLLRNSRISRTRVVTPIRLALGRGPGFATMAKSAINYGDHRLGGHYGDRDGVRVQIDSLDNQLQRIRLPRIDLLKIDVQGYEQEVFAGMSETLRRTPPRAILMEYWPYGIRQSGGDPDTFFTDLMRVGYSPGLLLDDGSVEFTDYDGILSRLPTFDPSEPDRSYVNVVLVLNGDDDRVARGARHDYRVRSCGNRCES